MRLSRRLPVCALLLPVLVLAAPRAAVAATPMTSDAAFGYNVGAVPREHLLTQVSAVWNVAAATQLTPGEVEAVHAFVSLGGGCVTYDCLVNDNTSLAVGTETSVSAGGAVTHRAWYSGGVASRATVPLAVAAGDDVRGTVGRVKGLAVLWRLTLRNLTTGATWTTVTPGVSMMASARFMVEAGVRFDEFGYGYPMMPDLAATRFDEVTVNGANAQLHPDERVVLVAYEDLDVVAVPSLPQPDGNGFGACAWATTCAVPPNF